MPGPAAGPRGLTVDDLSSIGDLFLWLRASICSRRSAEVRLLQRLSRGELIPTRPERLIRGIQAADGDIPPSLRAELRGPFSDERALELLLTVDEAFETFARDEQAWPRTRAALASPTVDRSSSLAPSYSDQVLLPRWLPSGTLPPGRGTLDCHFNWLRRAEATCVVRWRMLDENEDLPEQGHTVRVGVVPLMNQEDARFRRDDVGEARFFRVEHTDGKTVLKRLVAAVVACRRAQVDVLFAPELVLTCELWEALERALSKLPISSIAWPRWLLLGTALVDCDDGAANRARVLTLPGLTRWQQDKLSPYAMSLGERRTYGLEDDLGDGQEPIQETARPGEELWLLDSRVLGRVAIVICEDLATFAAMRAAQLGASVLFAPVMDGPLKEDRWAAKQAEKYNYAGCRVLVANSLVLPQRAGQRDSETWPSPHGFALCRDFVAPARRGAAQLRRAAHADLSFSKLDDWCFDLRCRT